MARGKRGGGGIIYRRAYSGARWPDLIELNETGLVRREFKEFYADPVPPAHCIPAKDGEGWSTKPLPLRVLDAGEPAEHPFMVGLPVGRILPPGGAAIGSGRKSRLWPARARLRPVTAPSEPVAETVLTETQIRIAEQEAWARWRASGCIYGMYDDWLSCAHLILVETVKSTPALEAGKLAFRIRSRLASVARSQVKDAEKATIELCGDASAVYERQVQNQDIPHSEGRLADCADSHFTVDMSAITERERDVIEMIHARGCTLSETAIEIGISESTVKRDLASVKSKLKEAA